MVDHHPVGLLGHAPRPVHMAARQPRAGVRQAVLARGADPGAQRRTLVQPGQFGEVALHRRCGPTVHMLQPGGQRRIAQAAGNRSAAGLLQALQADVAGASLEQRHPHRQAQCAAQGRDVAREQLILQRLGGGRQQGTASTQQQWCEVGKGLAHTRTGLHRKPGLCLQRFGHGTRRLNLGLAWLQASRGVCSQWTIGGKKRCYRVHKDRQTLPPTGTGKPMVNKAQQDTAHPHRPPG
ncbi:hypothetical protein FQZ97_789770 [compost metagenome]